MSLKLFIEEKFILMQASASEIFINYRDLTMKIIYIFVSIFSFCYKQNKWPLSSILIEATELLGQFGSKSPALWCLPWSAFKAPLWATACPKG